MVTRRRARWAALAALVAAGDRPSRHAALTRARMLGAHAATIALALGVPS